MAHGGTVADANSRAAWLAMMASLFMISYHVAGKAVRDALFLSHFDVTTLPRMVMVASLFSIVSVLAASRAMTRYTPARLVPLSFLFSAGLQCVVWLLIHSFPKTCAVILYLHTMGLGSILTSGFWSLMNERFDPRTARRVVGRIAAAGTVGGMVGGLVAERLAAVFSLPVLIPVLAFYHLGCGVLLFGLRPAADAAASHAPPPEDKPSGWEIIKGAPYLRTLAALVILGTISAAMIDYVFKSQALGSYGRGENLLRFFALFYSLTGLMTFMVQTGLSSVSLSRLGLAKTVGTLPFAVSIGGLGALVAPGLASATMARGLELVFRGSLFRAGYELFYTPMPTQEKRSAKAVVDVAFDRLGDAVGSGLVSVLLLIGPGLAVPGTLTGAILVALGAVWIANRLQGAYIDALERGLMERGGDLAAAGVGNSIAMNAFVEAPTLISGAPSGRRSAGSSDVTPVSEFTTPDAPGESTRQPSRTTIQADPVIQQTLTLRSGNATHIRQMLQNPQSLRAYHIPHLIALLAWDRVSSDVMAALRATAARHSGQLLDALLDPQTDFSVRRRLPRVLAAVPSAAVAQGLLHGLNDKRFEVRFQCGRSLAAIQATNLMLRFDPEQILGAIRREVAVSKPVWDSHRLLDRSEETEGNLFVDEYLRDRVSRSLQHLFTLLALVFPAEALKVAFHGLHVEDGYLRGTALEYLDSILPADIRERLWPLLERPSGETKQDQRPREQILDELLKSNHSIMVRLEELRKRTRAE